MADNEVLPASSEAERGELLGRNGQQSASNGVAVGGASTEGSTLFDEPESTTTASQVPESPNGRPMSAFYLSPSRCEGQRLTMTGSLNRTPTFLAQSTRRARRLTMKTRGRMPFPSGSQQTSSAGHRRPRRRRPMVRGASRPAGRPTSIRSPTHRRLSGAACLSRLRMTRTRKIALTATTTTGRRGSSRPRPRARAG
jgi:hypothetical protein